jgi:hypothetical protein
MDWKRTLPCDDAWKQVNLLPVLVDTSGGAIETEVMP